LPNWTKEQLDAINFDNSNIIVSAGAGSGKTAVLSERVIRKLKDGIEIDNLLILTFTSAAASEMKQRIRKKISSDESLKKQIEKIDSAYITTFDSFALSIVKKYHYLLNLSSNIKIIESSIINIKKQEYLDEILNQYYSENDSDNLKLISDFCTKDDLEIRTAILNINNKLDLIYNKEEYVNKYLGKFYSDEFIDNKINDFENLLLEKVANINKNLNELEEYVDNEYYEKISDVLEELLISTKYKNIKDNLEIKLPMLPKNSIDEAKLIKERISSLIKELKKLCIYEDIEEIKNGILSTKDYVSTILKIILKLDKKIMEYKFDNDSFEFNDIAKLAIKIIEENEFVRNELKYKFNEIMIDEYQDTNDLQDLFISYISNNNVYMVGDIKQSIYRFRNANPKLFQEKYDNYSNNNGGVKIDLNKNFRSREEVLDDINLIFNNIMDYSIGGADYKNSHQMIFGNKLYNEIGFNNQNNNLEILNYIYDSEKGFTKQEIEIFIIAKDIKEKIDNKYQVFDMDLGKNRNVNYSDFAILMDRTTNFDLYKKIFEYFNIPLTLYKDERITDNVNLGIIKNILNLIIKVMENNYNKSFEYSFMSVSRSYLLQLEDEFIFDMISNKNYEGVLLNKIKNIVSNIESLNLEEIIHLIINEFNFYEKFILIGNMTNNIVSLEYILSLASNLSETGYTINDFYKYLDDIIKMNFDIKFSLNDSSDNSVKIMTIHKSKGLEFSICYYSGLYAKFNISDIKERFIFDNEFGIITPYIDRGIHFTIYKDLLKNRYIKEEISEKIRLFYVALTRAKEKMILVSNDLDASDLYDFDKLKYMSFYDIVNSISNLIINKKNIEINDLKLTKDYNILDQRNYVESINLTNDKLDIIEFNYASEYEENEQFSKNSNNIYSKEDFDNIEYGKKIHSLFENVDFLNPDYTNMNDYEKNLITKFINTNIFDGVINIYKEYEFIDIIDNVKYHGIIDLLLEYEDKFKIIDYKLKNIKDDAYKKQLLGYKKYIEKISDKKVNIYLYSILDNTLEQL